MSGDKIFNKKTLITELLAKNSELSSASAAQIIDLLIDTISTILICGDRVTLNGFGSFVVKKRAKRVTTINKAHNSKDSVRKSLHFCPSHSLMKIINNYNAED